MGPCARALQEDFTPEILELQKKLLIEGFLVVEIP